MKKALLFFSLISITFINAQSSWKKINSKNYSSKSKNIVRKSNPKKFDLYSLNLKSFKTTLPQRKGVKKTIQLPNTKGGSSSFYVEETLNFTNPLPKKYGYIKSFNIKGIDDKTASGKISIGNDGVFVVINSGKHSTLYIDPYTKDKATFIAYERKSLNNEKSDFDCLVKDTGFSKKTVNTFQKRGANDSKLRTYRLALACTGEYAQFHIKQQGVSSSASDATKKAAVLSAMNTTITRINNVYERELAVKMNIVVNTSGENELIFLDPATDNLTNNEASILINESQNICDTIIGNDNYDIGHTFSTGAGGYASVGVVCSKGSKAKGVTGTSNPINDAYDIDFVAHEFGHQFGAPHTFNNSCDGNRSDGNSVEPGSGSTIMGYAGTCAPNVQENSNDYFHAESLAKMWNIIKNKSCAVETNTNNTPPTANAGIDVSVPKSTPLILKGQATDADGSNTLTYCWEQFDSEIASQPPVSTNVAGPNFRSLPPTESPNRYLPALATVLSGSTSSTWEVIPSVAREMNFSLLVRDNNSGGGSTARDDLKITVTDAEPFTVTSQNNATTWSTGTKQTITWNKSTTDQTPINCANVTIKLSTDGGLTFPITLVESTPNDGNHKLTVPNHPTTTARIMVEAIDNIFYNVNATNFTIDSTVPTFLVANTTNLQTVCNNNTDTAVYTLNLQFLNGFNEAVSFSATNLPNGVSATFSPTTINTNGNVTMTLSNFSESNPQNYMINVVGSATNLSQNTDANLTVYGTNFSELGLSSPRNGSTEVVTSPDLQWGNDSNATSYSIQIATDNNFSNIVVNTDATTNSYTLTTPLENSTTYYWRVKSKNDCGEGAFSSISSFTTQAPSYCPSTYNESEDSEYISNVTFNTINNNSGNDHSPTADDGYQDFTTISTTVKRTLTYEISVSFEVGGYQDHCYVFIDWNQDFIFDETNERYDLGSLYAAPNTPTAPGPLTMKIKVPEDAVLGETRMRVNIEYFGDGAPNGTGACTNDHNSGWGETEDYTIVIEEKPVLDFSIANTNNNLSICNKTTNKQTLKLDYKTINGFSENVNLSVSGLPNNVSATFSPTTINKDGTINLTLSNLNNAPIGDYTLIVTAKATSFTKTTEIKLNINDTICEDDFATSTSIFNDLNTYPVPSYGKINLNFKVIDKNLIIIRLYNLDGKLVNTQKFSTPSSLFNRKIDLGTLGSGIYILQIENAGETTSKKIIIR